MRAIYPLLPLALALLVVGSARAATLTVPLDHAERLNLRGTAANVVVGDPSVADVTVVDSHTLYVIGRGYGSTGLEVTDGVGRTLFSGEVAVARPPSNIAVYRGAVRTDFACATTCAQAHNAGDASAAAPAGGDGDGSGASSPASPGK